MSVVKVARRPAALIAVVALSLVPFAAAQAAPPSFTEQAVSEPSGVVKSKTVSRVHLINGQDAPVDSRTVTVTLSQTTFLRDRQSIEVKWQGAHPTGGFALNVNSYLAAHQEYPMMIMECRGVDSPTAPVDQQISPSTCWTQTASERIGADFTFAFPPFRLDRYAAAEQRGLSYGLPSNAYQLCGLGVAGAQHWVPWVTVDGSVFGGGPDGCAGLPPEASDADNNLAPSNTTYGITDVNGNGSVNFVIQTKDSNASMGCSQTVACSIVVVPIMGISCDPDASALTRPNRPTVLQKPQAQSLCTKVGHYAPGQASDGSAGTEDVAVSGSLWWSESNWRNRLTFPMSFAPDSNVCELTGAGKPTYMYGSTAMVEATQQWAPAFCLDPKKFAFQHVQFSEPGSRSLLNNGSVDAALVGGPPDPSNPYTKPVVQSPMAFTGFAIAFSIDDRFGGTVNNLRLTPRLLAKLMTMSYPGSSDVASEYKALSSNPLDIIADPEFRALNPDQMFYSNGYSSIPASVLYSISSDSDLMTALTSYINADDEARAWLDGQADPWGMVVNPNYKGIELPVNNWPIRDSFISTLTAKNNPCLNTTPVPILPQFASPVSIPATISLNMQYDIANSQIICKDAGLASQRLVSIGRLPSGRRTMLGLVSLADARRFSLRVASLETGRDASAPAKFGDATGRYFAAPDQAGMSAALKLLKPDPAQGTWIFPYKDAQKGVGRAAYPGAMLMSLNVPTLGLAAAEAGRYATLMRWAISTGQVPGFGVGQLPDGYLPLTKAVGAQSLLTFAEAAATAVAAQKGQVPSLDGKFPAPSPSPSPSPSVSASTPVPKPTPIPTPTYAPDPTPTPAPTSPSVSASPIPSTGAPSSRPPSGTPSPSALPTGQASPVATASTPQFPMPASASVLPLLALLALLSGATAFFTGWRGSR